MAQGDSRLFLNDARGASEVVAVALLIGITVMGVGVILLVGASQLGETQDDVAVGQAEQALVQFDSEAARVATGGTASQQVDLGLRSNMGTLNVENDTGHIRIEFIKISFFDTYNSTELVNTSLGTLIYDHGDTTVSYQGGGVWRSDGNASLMVSPPEITLRNRTLNVPLILTDRGGSVHSDVRIAHENTVDRFPDLDRNLTNKVEAAKITITIQSRYYWAWGQYFEDETDVIVQYNHQKEIASITFLALPLKFSPTAGVIATSGPGEINLAGNGAYIDSYNSLIGPYDVSRSQDGRVTAAGDVILKGDSQIDGDVRSGRDIRVESSAAQIDGDANYTRNIETKDAGSVTGESYEIDGVPDIPPINPYVENQTEYLEENNDNNATDVIVDNELDIDETGSGTLTSGNYFLYSLDLRGETLVLDTTGGNITIGVRDYVTLLKYQGDNSHIRVEGDGYVRFFVLSERKADVSIPGGGKAPMDNAHFFAERNATLYVANKNARRVQLYAPDNFIGAIGGSSSENANITATIIAPAGREGPGEFFMQHGELYGAVVTGNLTMGQYGQVHFDRALAETDIPIAPKVPRIEFLYVSENKIKVEGG